MCLGVPGKVVEMLPAEQELNCALVEFAGLRRKVCTACVPEAQVGDYVIVHAGLAISIVDPTEARRVFDYLKAIGEYEGWTDPETLRDDNPNPEFFDEIRR